MRQVLHGSARPGFLLVEALIGIAVFVLFAGAIGGTLLYGQENTIMAGDRMRATSAALKALEAARAVRDSSFASLAVGTYGVKIGPSGLWTLVANAPQTTTGSYTTTLTLTVSGSNWMRADARTVWKHGYARSGAVLMSTDITNWRTTTSLGDWRTPTVEGTYQPGGNILFGRAAIAGSTLYVTTGNSDGLHIVDISNTASPTRLASSFSIGSAAFDVAARGKRLYVLSADSNAELKVYNIENPASPVEVTTVNLQGSGRGRSLAITDEILLVGTTASDEVGQSSSAGNGLGSEEVSIGVHELYAYDISGTGALTLVDSENDDGDVLEISVSGTGVYIASSQDSYELRAYVISDSGSLSLSSVPGYNLSDRTLDGQVIAVTGTSAVLGTLKGSVQEMVVFNLRPEVPAVSSPGPWYHEGSGSIVGADMDRSRCYAFVAADSGRKALQVVLLRDTSSLSELTTYNSSTGKARSVLYDPVRDRVILSTDQAVLIFSPAASTGICP